MSKNSKIEWTDHTFNPWLGCTKISPGCDHCYAESWAKRGGHPALWQGQRRRTTESNWQQPIKWNAEAEAQGVRYRVFCASLADVFDNEADPAWRSDLFKLIAATPNLDWLLLTKRIGNVKALCGGVSHLQNVWLGATVINQEEADRDIPKLLATPARVRFLSIEPMLGPISLPLEWLAPFKETDPALNRTPRIDWVICGGESGPHARPMDPRWAKSLRDQCIVSGIAFFFKQWGEWQPYMHGHAYIEGFKESRISTPDGATPNRNGWPVYLVGKKAAGRELDGRTWDEVPL